MRNLFPPIALLFLVGCAGNSPRPVSNQQTVDKVLDAAIQANLPDVALRISSEQVDRNPNDATALVRQASAYRAMGRDTAAEAAYIRALAINPDNAPAQLGIGTLKLHSDPAAAETAFRRVLARQAQNPVALTGLGIARDLQGDHQAAQTAYHAALAAQPDLRAAQINLGLSLALSGKSAEAVGLLQSAADEPQATRRERDDLAVAMVGAGRIEEARRILGEEMSDEDARRTIAAYRMLF